MNAALRSRGMASLVLAALLSLNSAACTDFLEVENPGAIEEADVNDPSYASLLVNGVIGEFQPAFSTTALYSAVFTDELSNWHGFIDNIDIDRRAVALSNGTVNGSVYTPLHSTRFLADTTAALLRDFFGDSAARHVSLARVLAYGGYSYTLLGEQMCESPVGLTTAYTSDQLLGFALTRLRSAIEVATAAKAFYGGIAPATTQSTRNASAADSILNLARVGAARVSLDLGDKAGAVTYASAVPAAFGFRVYHSANSGRETNPFFSAASGGPNAEWVGITFTPFETITGDPRIPRPTTTERTQQGTALVPNSPLAFSTYSGTTVGADFTRDASIQFASGLEARYIVAEAQGANATNIAFLNSRRTIGGQAALAAPTESEFQAALREQRARDLYLAAYRLGDLRRYKARYGVNLFQTGQYQSVVPAPSTFGTDECWPIPLAEYNGNPNLPRP